MVPTQNVKVLNSMLVAFLNAHTHDSLYSMDLLQDKLVATFSQRTLQLLPIHEARILDQTFFHRSGMHLRALYGWPYVGSVVSVDGMDLHVTKAGLFTFNGAPIAWGSVYADDSSDGDPSTGREERL